MGSFVKLTSITYPSEAAIVLGRLESEGIETQVRDEHTVEVASIYSNAVGGIKIYVLENDLHQAKAIIAEAGYGSQDQSSSPDIFHVLDKRTNRIPILRALRVEMRLLIMTAVIVSIPLLITFLILRVSTFEYLTEQTWCVDQVSFNGQLYRPVTEFEHAHLSIQNCSESIVFDLDGQLTLPGFQTPVVTGNWALIDGNVHISGLSGFNEIYEGVYTVESNPKELVLSSEISTIYCRNLWQ